MSKDYWIPKYKWELVEWLNSRREADWNRLTKKQLYAIYFNIRNGYKSSIKITRKIEA